MSFFHVGSDVPANLLRREPEKSHQASLINADLIHRVFQVQCAASFAARQDFARNCIPKIIELEPALELVLSCRGWTHVYSCQTPREGVCASEHKVSCQSDSSDGTFRFEQFKSQMHLCLRWLNRVSMQSLKRQTLLLVHYWQVSPWVPSRHVLEQRRL